MDRCRSLLLVLVVLAAFAGVADAQTSTPTRAETVQAARTTKAARPAVSRTGRVERVLTTLENGAVLQRWLGPRDGFVIRLGGIEDGPGMALGPAWRESDAFGGALQFSASAAGSIGGDTDMDAAVSVPRLGTSRLALRADASASKLAHERFFGQGLTSQREHETAFGLARRSVLSSASFTAAKWLRVSAGGGVLEASVAGSASARVPTVRTLFPEARGLGADPRFTVVSVGATVDYRDVEKNPRSGGRYAITATRYADRRSASHSFTRVDLELEQHLSAWRRQRVLTVRALASMSAPDAGHDVPFYLQRTLGGSRSLRGFVTDRFRDRQLVLMQAEYGWDVMPFLGAVLFLEGGAVAREWRDFSAQDLRRDYGVGFRFGSARTVALRADVAFGSGEGTRFTLRTGHAF